MAAKVALTRVGKGLIYQLEHKRPSDEVRECLGKLKSVFDNLLSKHEGFTNLLEDDEEFEKEESWIDECQICFMRLHVDAKNYMESIDMPKQSNNTELVDQECLERHREGRSTNCLRRKIMRFPNGKTKTA